jgi:hypothetical protein
MLQKLKVKFREKKLLTKLYLILFMFNINQSIKFELNGNPPSLFFIKTASYLGKLILEKIMDKSNIFTPEISKIMGESQYGNHK